MSIIQPETHMYWFWTFFCSVKRVKYNWQTRKIPKESAEFFNLFNSAGPSSRSVFADSCCAAKHGNVRKCFIELWSFNECAFASRMWDYSNTARFNPGFLWLLLGLQCCRGLGGPAGQEDREAGGPQPPKPGGLFRQIRQPRLQRWLNALCLPVRHRQPGHRLWRFVPLRRTCE